MSLFDFDVVTGPSLQRKNGPACAIHYDRPAPAKMPESADDDKRSHISETDRIASGQMSR